MARHAMNHVTTSLSEYNCLKQCEYALDMLANAVNDFKKLKEEPKAYMSSDDKKLITIYEAINSTFMIHSESYIDDDYEELIDEEDE